MSNWIYNNKKIKDIEDFPKEVIGFIYRINNLSNGRYYIGRKSLRSVRNTKIAKSTYDRLKKEGGYKLSRRTNKSQTKKQKKKVWNHYREDIKETNWKTYKGSSKDLLNDINKNKHEIHKEIIHLCYTKTEMTYKETTEILCSGCFEDPNCYNGWVSAKIRKDLL